MIFLVQKDYYPLIVEDHLLEIIEDDTTLLDQIELSNLATCRSFTGAEFTVDCLYPIIITDTGLTSSQYTPGEYIYDLTDTQLIYQNIATASGTVSFTDTDFYQLNDPRSPQIIKIMVDLCLYDLNSRISSIQIPQLRQDRFDYAMLSLKEISNGNHYGLPQECRTVDNDGDGVTDVYYGSNTKLDQRW